MFVQRGRRWRRPPQTRTTTVLEFLEIAFVIPVAAALLWAMVSGR
jgi:hypothetical protein